ncbi:MAG TPA: 3-oxoacyl-ACP synthase, partial [bacterium]|nr:3-oxoacyl-ACP synthase [bacterium]
MERVRVISSGYYLPPRILTNKDLEKTVETSDGWITTRTGIKERHIASSEQATSDLGIEAGRMALNKAGLAPEKIGALICATITPDYAFPSTACMIQKGLGLNQAFALDISAACSGFLYAVTLAESLLLQNRAEYVMVVAAEKLSSFTDWTDRNTCVLFGDGAGAVILKKEKGNRGILSS